jgi:peroxin-19
MPAIDDLEIGNDFARELADGMAALMREIAAESAKPADGAAAGASTASTEEERQREAAFRKAWEDMIVEGMNGALDVDDFGGKGKGKAPAKPGETPKADVDEDKFQSTIRKAMDKLTIAETDPAAVSLI